MVLPNEQRVLTLLNAGRKKAKRDHAAEEAKKLGIMRGGNAGMFDPDDGGKVVGKCLCISLLRMHGLEFQAPEADFDNTDLMFEAGYTNEDSWASNLIGGLADTGEPLILKREEELPLTWKASNGVVGTGRADLALCKAAQPDVPAHGIELKLVCSLWTARDVLCGFPKMQHLIQASWYQHLMGLGVKYDLWYTCRSDFAIDIKNCQSFPHRDKVTKNSRFDGVFDWGPKGWVKKVTPFVRGFHLQSNKQGEVSFTEINHTGTVLAYNEWTMVEVPKIAAYYDELARLYRLHQDTEFQILPPIVVNHKGEKEGYTACQYCELQSYCKGRKITTTKQLVSAAQDAGFQQIG